MNRAERRKNELRERILAAAFELFLSQGVSVTRIDEICDRADIASRTFFNHFPTRRDMVRALAESRLVNLHDVVFARSDEPVPQRLVGVFDDIATTLVDSGETYREMIGEMMAAADYGAQRGSPFHETFVELVKDGLARGEIHTRHDPQIVADIVVGALSGAIVNWRVDTTYSLVTNLHNLGLALAGLLVGRMSVFGFATTGDDVIDGVDLTGKTAAVTGASSGLGLQTVATLAFAGARSWPTGRPNRRTS